MVAPSAFETSLVLLRLKISRRMLLSIVEAVHRAYCGIREVLAQKFFMAFSVLCMAMLSRFHSQLQVADLLLWGLTENLTNLLPFCASPLTSPALDSLLDELRPLAAPPLPPPSRPSPLSVPRAFAPAILKKSPAARPVDLGGPSFAFQLAFPALTVYHRTHRTLHHRERGEAASWYSF